MKKTILPIVLMALLSCTTERPDFPAEDSNRITLDVAGHQSKVVANKTTAVESSAIGQRTAEEMVAAGFKRYGIEKGTLIFRHDGALKGTENLYFDHWGWREGKFINTEADVGPYDKVEKKVQFLDGERRYEYNMQTEEAYFFESKQVQRSADQYGTKDMTIVADEMIKKMGGVRDSTGIVKGVECQIWDIDKYKTVLHMWKGITMKERSHPNNIPVARTCILLDTVSEIPLEKLVLPDHIKPININ